MRLMVGGVLRGKSAYSYCGEIDTQAYVYMPVQLV